VVARAGALLREGDPVRRWGEVRSEVAPSSWRKPGPITTNMRVEARWGPQRAHS